MRYGLKQKMANALTNFLLDESQWASSLAGTHAIYELEQKFCRLLHKRYAVTFSSATAALYAVLSRLHGRNKRVITSPYAWGAAVGAILQSENRPEFVDITRNDLTLDAARLADAITPDAVAILGVDVYGHPCGPELGALARQHDLLYIQDCAAGFGSYIEDRHTGSCADVAIFSFGYNKRPYGGEGGIAVTSDEELYRHLTKYQHPVRQRRDLPEQDSNEFSLNLRMNPLAAAAVNAVFDETMAEVERHRQRCLRLLQALVAAGLTVPARPQARVKPSFQTFTFQPIGARAEVESWLAEHAKGWRLSPAPIQKPLYTHPYYRALAAARKWPIPRCPVAEEQCARRVSLSTRDDDVLISQSEEL